MALRENISMAFNSTNETMSEGFQNLPILILGSFAIVIGGLSGVSVIVTYLLFKELRTLYSILLMNFILAVIVSGFTLLGFIIPTSIPELCAASASMLHYTALVRMVAISCLMVEAITHFYHVLKLKPSSNKTDINKKALAVYLVICWGSPAVLVATFVVVNHTVEDSIMYGETDGRCFINGLIPLLVGVLLPLVGTSILNIVCGVFVLYVLVKVGHKNVRARMSLDARRKRLIRDIRVIFAVFLISGLSWIFGALSLISQVEPSLRWSDYVFIILEPSQMVFLAVIYICTKRVARLYCNLLCCQKNSTYSKSANSKSTPEPPELRMNG